MKINYACGLLVVLLLSALLAPSPAQAEPAALRWTSVDKPGTTGNVVVSPSEVSEIAIGSNGVLYAIDSENSKVYRSLDGGVTWEDITFSLADAGAGLPASKIAIAPDKPGILAVVTDGSTAVYLSTDGGMDWVDTGVPGLAGDIQAIAISEEYTQDGKSFREIAIGTAEWGDDDTSGQVWVYQIGKSWAPWQNQELTVDPSHIGGEVSALAYSPDYADDMTILVVASTGISDVSDDYKNKTWLCLGLRDTSEGTTSWNTLPDFPPPVYPVEVAESGDVPSAGDGSGISVISSLALPLDYSSEEASSRQLFVSYDREPIDAGDDVYWLDDNIPVRLKVLGGNPINICSIAYHGTTTSGVLLAGDVNPVTGSKTVQVRRTSEPFEASPDWEEASVPPTGPGNAKLGWSPDGEIAYCGTGQSPGYDLDESALSASVDDGDKWRQMGLIDTEIRLADVVPAPDSESLFLITYSPYGPEGIWRSTSDPLGRYWQRLLTMDTDTDAVILRLSPNYSDDHTIYAAEVGGNLMAVSHSGGNSWDWRQAPGSVVDIVVEDENTLYLALPDGVIKKSTRGGHIWKSQGDTSLAEINMLAFAGEETILIGGRNGEVAYSTDGGASFTRIPEVIGSGTGDVQVVGDANYLQNGVIYAATNLADEGIWRWTIGVSTEWEQIDESGTELGEGQKIGGLAVGWEGTLYALRLEPATSASGGVVRSVNPTEPDPVKVEFELVNRALPDGTTFDPTPLFPTLPYLKLSGNYELNELWTIDTSGEIIYRFRDTLCKLGPILVMPAAGDIILIDSTGYISSLTLQWEELVGATEYEAAIYLNSEATSKVWSGTTAYLAINATKGSNPAQLISGTKYYWRVRAIEPTKSPWSETQSFASPLGVAQWSPLVLTSEVSPPPGANDVPIRPAFSWESADGATGYEFVLARDSGFTDVVVALTGADALPSTAWGCDRDLDYSTTYFWKVRAISADSYSEWGTNVFTTEATPSALLPPQPPPPLVLEPAPSIPSYSIVAAIGIGVILIVTLLVFIVRRR
jgi:photosystem II stability/assembly factor-like uncharacterized protein